MARQSAGIARASFLAGLASPVAVALVPRGILAQEAPVRVVTTLTTFFAEPYLAADLGIFRRAGLNVEVTGVGNGELTIAAVATGSADIGVTATLQLATAVSHDLPVRLVGYGGQYTSAPPPAGLYVARDSPLRDAKSLEGKTVGVNTVQSTNFLGVQAWLAQNNVDPAKVHAIEIPFSQIAASIKRGTIDAGIMAEPFITPAKDDVRLLAPVFETLGPHWSVSVWFSRIDYIRANGPLVKRVIDAAYQTAKYVNAHTAEANQILSKYTKLPVETLNAMAPTEFAEGPAPNTARIELDLAFKYKLLPRPVSVNDLTSIA